MGRRLGRGGIGAQGAQRVGDVGVRLFLLAGGCSAHRER